jgi:hypothetical protein
MGSGRRKKSGYLLPFLSLPDYCELTLQAIAPARWFFSCLPLFHLVTGLISLVPSDLPTGWGQWLPAVASPGPPVTSNSSLKPCKPGTQSEQAISGPWTLGSLGMPTMSKTQSLPSKSLQWRWEYEAQIEKEESPIKPGLLWGVFEALI